MKTQFLGQAYKARSLPLEAQTLINLYIEVDETQQGSEPAAFYGTPGLTLRNSDGAGEVRGLLAIGAYLYAVIGNTVYAIDYSWHASSLGTLPNSSGRVSMTYNDTQLLISHSDGWHYVTLPTTLLAAVADTDQPTDSIVTYQDGYVIFTQGGGEFGITALSDVTSIDPLDFATAEGAPDDTVAVLSDHRELWLFGTRTTEVWYNSGDPSFPFTRAVNGFLETGTVARWSPAKADNTVFWLGQDDKGAGVVYRADGYTPKRISTFAIETAIASYSRIDDAFGYCTQQDGHVFYVLTFPTGDATWVFDVASGAWHQRAWMDSNGVLHRHRGNCHAYFNNYHVVGDWENGKIYTMEPDVYTDDGEEIYRERAWAHIEKENRWIRHNRLELIGEMGVGLDGSPTLGVNPTVTLRYSNDGGRTWSNEHTQSMGPIGQTDQIAVWRRLGLGFRRVYEVSTTDPVKVAWFGANLDAEVV